MSMRLRDARYSARACGGWLGAMMYGCRALQAFRITIEGVVTTSGRLCWSARLTALPPDVSDDRA